MTNTNSWPALRSIAQIFKILAYVVGGLGALAAIIVLFTGQGFLGRVGGFIFTLLASGIYALFLVATSEGIRVGLAVEENTRKTAENLGNKS